MVQKKLLKPYFHCGPLIKENGDSQKKAKKCKEKRKKGKKEKILK